MNVVLTYGKDFYRNGKLDRYEFIKSFVFDSDNFDYLEAISDVIRDDLSTIGNVKDLLRFCLDEDSEVDYYLHIFDAETGEPIDQDHIRLTDWLKLEDE